MGISKWSDAVWKGLFSEGLADSRSNALSWDTRRVKIETDGAVFSDVADCHLRVSELRG